jgi:hypothetical protein
MFFVNQTNKKKRRDVGMNRQKENRRKELYFRREWFKKRVFSYITDVGDGGVIGDVSMVRWILSNEFGVKI